MAFLLLVGAAGCKQTRAPRVISAELLDDKIADGQPSAGETIRVTLDRPLPKDFRPQQVKVLTGPPRTPLLARVGSGGPRTLEIELISTPPPWRASGTYSGAVNQTMGGPTGLGLDLGAAGGGEQWVDLQLERRNPTLERAVWDDRPAAGFSSGNLVVDRGDWIRLYFDREVRLAGGERVEARVPEDLLLTRTDDQLDDGKVVSVFRQEGDPREVLVVLGSNPRLTIAGRHRPSRRGEDRERGPFWPSGIAVNGTAVLPLEKIVARRGGLGAISSETASGGTHSREADRGGSVDIEFPEEYSFFEKIADERFPLPGHRTLQTITPIAGGRAIIAGGKVPGSNATDQVLLYNPEATRQIQPLGEMLPLTGRDPERKVAPGRYLHTATLFSGEDGILNTFDDFIVIAGGLNGEQSVGSLVAVRLLDPSSPEPFSIELIPTPLRVPREYHSAVFIPPDMLYLEGGRHTAPSGGGGIVSTAEILTLDARGGKISVRSQREIRILPRMRHTTTYLGTGRDGAHYLLTYGGFGVLPRQAPPEKAPGAPENDPEGNPRSYNADLGVVLAAPVLTRIETRPGAGGAPAEVQATQTFLDFEYRFEMLRYDHRAAAMFDAYGPPGEASREVLIAGGTLLPPTSDPMLPKRPLFETPRRPEEMVRLTWKPTYSESAAALVFEFQPAEPLQSRFRIVESPSGDSRVHLALVPLANPGPLILGGENPIQPKEVFVTGEVYLKEERRLAPLAVPLAIPRTRFSAYAVEEPGRAEVYLLGGSSPDVDPAEFPEVERLKLEYRKN